ncbi:MAG: hypothetical protein ACO308_02825 [Burkholderiaceae bacterium]
MTKRQGAYLAVAATQGKEGLRLQPVFSLVHVDLQGSLRQFLESGQRRFTDWLTQQNASLVLFEQSEAFANANSLKDLDALEHKVGRS